MKNKDKKVKTINDSNEKLLLSDVNDSDYLRDFKEWANKILSDEKICRKFLIDTGIHNEDGTLHKKFGGK